MAAQFIVRLRRQLSLARGIPMANEKKVDPPPPPPQPPAPRLVKNNDTTLPKQSHVGNVQPKTLDKG